MAKRGDRIASWENCTAGQMSSYEREGQTHRFGIAAYRASSRRRSSKGRPLGWMSANAGECASVVSSIDSQRGVGTGLALSHVSTAASLAATPLQSMP